MQVRCTLYEEDSPRHGNHFTRRRDPRLISYRSPVTVSSVRLLHFLHSHLYTHVSKGYYIEHSVLFFVSCIDSATMAKASASSPTATPPPPAALKKTSSSTQNMRNQKSILGFFQKSSPATPSDQKSREPASSPAQRASEQRGASGVKSTQKRSFSSFAQDLSPVPSSDLPIPDEDEENGGDVKVGRDFLRSRLTRTKFFPLADSTRRGPRHHVSFTSSMSSPHHKISLHVLTESFQAKKQVSYKESDSEGEDDDDVIFRPCRKNGARGRAAKRRKTSPDSGDEFQQNGDDGGYSEDGMFRSNVMLKHVLTVCRNGRLRRG